MKIIAGIGGVVFGGSADGINFVVYSNNAQSIPAWLMGVFETQESVANSEAETESNAVANVPLIKKKSNMKGIILFMLNIMGILGFSYKKSFC